MAPAPGIFNTTNIVNNRNINNVAAGLNNSSKNFNNIVDDDTTRNNGVATVNNISNKANFVDDNNFNDRNLSPMKEWYSETDEPTVNTNMIC